MEKLTGQYKIDDIPLSESQTAGPEKRPGHAVLKAAFFDNDIISLQSCFLPAGLQIACRAGNISIPRKYFDINRLSQAPKSVQSVGNSFRKANTPPALYPS